MDGRGDKVAAVLAGISFAAGLSLYATYATLGLMAHCGLINTSPELQLLGNGHVIVAAHVLSAIEFVATRRRPSIRRGMPHTLPSARGSTRLVYRGDRGNGALWRIVSIENVNLTCDSYQSRRKSRE